MIYLIVMMIVLMWIIFLDKKKNEINNFDIDVLGNDNIEKNVNKKDNENLNKLKKFYV